MELTNAPWIIMPVMADPEKTEAAISDCLAQSVPTRLLVINQGVQATFRERLERIAEAETERVFVWHHNPPLPSLSATWNRALRFVWTTCSGSTEDWDALVINNDVRLHEKTVEYLQRVRRREHALFVTAVGVTEGQFDAGARYDDYHFWDAHSEEPTRAGQLLHRGGPDFSCFLISFECHDRFQFDERFVPAFCEDLDYHRRLMLAGLGHRIFSVNLPYLHYASNTLKTLPGEEAYHIRAQIEKQSRAYYAEKWGGPVNQERFLLPFREDRARDDVTTPELQHYQDEVGFLLPDPDKRFLGGQGNYREPRRNAAGQVIERMNENAGGQKFAFPTPAMLEPNRLYGLMDDGLALTSGPPDGYRGIPRDGKLPLGYVAPRESPDDPGSSRRRGSAGNWDELNAETTGKYTNVEDAVRAVNRLNEIDRVLEEANGEGQASGGPDQRPAGFPDPPIDPRD